MTGSAAAVDPTAASAYSAPYVLGQRVHRRADARMRVGALSSRV